MEAGFIRMWVIIGARLAIRHGLPFGVVRAARAGEVMGTGSKRATLYTHPSSGQAAAEPARQPEGLGGAIQEAGGEGEGPVPAAAAAPEGDSWRAGGRRRGCGPHSAQNQVRGRDASSWQRVPLGRGCTCRVSLWLVADKAAEHLQGCFGLVSKHRTVRAAQPQECQKPGRLGEPMLTAVQCRCKLLRALRSPGAIGGQDRGGEKEEGERDAP